MDFIDPPQVLVLEDLSSLVTPTISGTYKGHLVLQSASVLGPKLIPAHNLMSVLHHAHSKKLSEAYLSLADSYQCMFTELPDLASTSCYDSTVPKNLKEAISPKFCEEWLPAIDRENVGFLNKGCFQEVLTLPLG